jgi:hypothetical protein
MGESSTGLAAPTGTPACAEQEARQKSQQRSDEAGAGL